MGLCSRVAASKEQFKGRWEMLKPEVEALVLWAGSVRY